ncbi:trypsin-like peptidase domain-containing protein [Candidatus Woesebacteria bacterium]|nr:trypsin-like peptidase domain-containing protein [Candidatus Woesebacteria bacterium]
MEWREGVEILEPYIVSVNTPNCSGTGFAIAYSSNLELCGIATAAHVISHAHYWEEPVRLTHYTTKESVLLRQADRFIFLNQAADTACIVFPKGEFPFPDKMLNISPEGKYLKIGVDVGWLGFPSIASGNLCFFSGRISSWMEDNFAYLIDGVAINGVSGGPAFWVFDDVITVIGVVSSYIANRNMGDTLPGLCVVQDVSPFREPIKQLKNLEEAKQQEKVESQVQLDTDDGCVTD